jgi:hypothetical protein
LFLLAALLALCAQAQADGGLVQLHQTAGRFVVTVFTAPNPPRVGPVDISVLAQDRLDGRAALDGEVIVRLRSEGGMTVVGQATRNVAQNKLLYSILMNLPEAGQWDLEVTIKQGKQGESQASVLGRIWVAQPGPFLLSYWRSLSLPWIVVTLFAMNQWLKRRAASRLSRRAHLGFRGALPVREGKTHCQNPKSLKPG